MSAEDYHDMSLLADFDYRNQYDDFHDRYNNVPMRKIKKVKVKEMKITVTIAYIFEAKSILDGVTKIGNAISRGFIKDYANPIKLEFEVELIEAEELKKENKEI